MQDLERVARALFDHEWSAFETKPDYEWEKHKPYWLEAARVAIAATEIEHLQSQLNAMREALEAHQAVFRDFTGPVEEPLMRRWSDAYVKAGAALKTVGSMG